MGNQQSEEGGKKPGFGGSDVRVPDREEEETEETSHYCHSDVQKTAWTNRILKTFEGDLPTHVILTTFQDNLYNIERTLDTLLIQRKISRDKAKVIAVAANSIQNSVATPAKDHNIIEFPSVPTTAPSREKKLSNVTETIPKKLPGSSIYPDLNAQPTIIDFPSPRRTSSPTIATTTNSSTTSSTPRGKKRKVEDVPESSATPASSSSTPSSLSKKRKTTNNSSAPLSKENDFQFESPKPFTVDQNKMESDSTNMFQFMGNVEPDYEDFESSRGKHPIKKDKTGWPLCSHDLPMKLRTVTKETKNKGRQFVCCPEFPSGSCGALLWIDEVVGLPSLIDLKEKQKKQQEIAKAATLANSERKKVVRKVVKRKPKNEEREEKGGGDEKEEDDEAIKLQTVKIKTLKEWQEKLREKVKFPFEAYLTRDAISGVKLSSPLQVTVDGFSSSFGEGTNQMCAMLCSSKQWAERKIVPLQYLSVNNPPKGYRWLRAYPY